MVSLKRTSACGFFAATWARTSWASATGVVVWDMIAKPGVRIGADIAGGRDDRVAVQILDDALHFDMARLADNEDVIAVGLQLLGGLVGRSTRGQVVSSNCLPARRKRSRSALLMPWAVTSTVSVSGSGRRRLSCTI